MMREYLATTTLGDLVRKSKDIQLDQGNAQVAGAAAPAAGAAAGTSNTGVASAIRSPIGEINQ